MARAIVYTKRGCYYCVAARRLLETLGGTVEEIDLAERPGLRRQLAAETGGYRLVPVVFIGGLFVGGFSDLVELHGSGKLVPMLEGAEDAKD